MDVKTAKVCRSIEVINMSTTVKRSYLPNIITSDAVILDKCESWINLNAKIIEEINADYPYIDMSYLKEKEII